MKRPSPETTQKKNRTNTAHHQRKAKENQLIHHTPFITGTPHDTPTPELENTRERRYLRRSNMQFNINNHTRVKTYKSKGRKATEQNEHHEPSTMYNNT